MQQINNGGTFLQLGATVTMLLWHQEGTKWPINHERGHKMAKTIISKQTSTHTPNSGIFGAEGG